MPVRGDELDPIALISTIWRNVGQIGQVRSCVVGLSTVIESRERVPGGRQCVRFRTNGAVMARPHDQEWLNPGAACILRCVRRKVAVLTVEVLAASPRTWSDP